MSAAYERVKSLSQRYRERDFPRDIMSRVRTLAGTYLRRRSDSLVDAATIAAGLTVGMLLERPDPQILEALRLQYPNVDPGHLDTYSQEELQGIVNGVKGKYFEVLIRDDLNAGDWVGTVHLAEGQEAVLATSPTQEGWDIRILDADGDVIEELQAKATESAQPIYEALSDHPDIDVIATSEAAEHFLGDPRVIDAGMLDDELTDAVDGDITELAEGPLTEFLESAIPWLSLVVIAGAEGSKVLFRLSPATDALRTAGFRSAKTVAASTVAAGFIAVDAGLLSIPAALTTRLYLDRIRWHTVATETVQRYTTWVSKVAPAGPMQALRVPPPGLMKRRAM